MSSETQTHEQHNIPKQETKKQTKFDLLSFIVTLVICGAVFYGALIAKAKYEDYELNKLKPKNDLGIEHCVINAPFDEEIYKYSFFPNYRKFKDEYYGKFEVIEKQMSVPLNITFYDADWKIVEEHPIVDLEAEEIADIIRAKGFYEHEDKEAYRTQEKEVLEENVKLSKEAFKKALEEGTDEEKKAYEVALDALKMTKEELLYPELYKAKQEAEKREAAKTEKVEKAEPKAIEYEEKAEL